jgi:hypothetical protein
MSELSPRRLETDRLADRIRERLVEEGETLESLLLALREECEQNRDPGASLDTTRSDADQADQNQ